MSILASGRFQLDDGANPNRTLVSDLLRWAPDYGRPEMLPFHALAEQADRLRLVISSPRPFETLRIVFPEIVHLELEAASLGILEPDLRSRVLRLLHAHLLEWDRFVGRVPQARPLPIQLGLELPIQRPAVAG